MAVCFFWRNLLICLVVCLTTPRTSGTTSISNIYHFIAPGTYRNKGLAPSPERFWDLYLSLGVWNLLQLSTDRSINPILRPYKHSRLPDRGANTSCDPRPAGRPPGTRDPVPQLSWLAGDIQEFARHMHKRDYPVVAEPQDACGAGSVNDHESTLLLLAIKTKVQNFKNRQIIRSTWGQAGWVAGQRMAGGGYVRRVFLLRTDRSQDNNTAWPDLLTFEGQQYRDVLQWDFHDSFFNLTLKYVLFWRWFSRGCRRTHFVFKGDDDVFVNTPALVDYLRQQLGNTGTAMQSFMVGDVIGAAQPNRNNKSKYFVPEAFYAGSYPPYAGGGGMVYSGLLTKLLHLVSKRVHLYPDDVYVGMCLLKLNTYPSHHPAFLTFDFPGDEEMEPCAYHRTIMVHKRMPNRVAQLWARLKKRQPLCWNVTLREEKL